MLWTLPDKLESCFEEPKVIVLRSALTYLIMILILLICICAIVVRTAYSTVRISTPRGGARPRLRYLAVQILNTAYTMYMYMWKIYTKKKQKKWRTYCIVRVHYPYNNIFALNRDIVIRVGWLYIFLNRGCVLPLVTILILLFYIGCAKPNICVLDVPGPVCR